MENNRRKRIYCPNCKSQLKAHMNFCFDCGQENNIKRVSIKILLNDFFSTYFTVNSKLLLTLKLLIIKPGFLSIAYLSGRIEGYLRPIRLYVFVSFVFFLLSTNLTSYKSTIERINLTLNEMPVTIGDLEDGFGESETAPKINENSLDKKIEKIFSTERETTIFFNYMLAKFPIVMFIMIPVLGLLFNLFFFNKSYYYIDYLIFSLHLQCFLLTLLIITTLIDWLLKIDLSIVAFLGLLIYGYIAALKFYKKKKLITFLKLCLVGVFHTGLIVVVCILFFLLVMQTYSV
jgi:hypothetical protein